MARLAHDYPFDVPVDGAVRERGLERFMGANLLQSAFMKWCLMEDILRWTGLHREREPFPSKGL